MGFQTAALRSESAAVGSESAALGFSSAAFCRGVRFRVSLRNGGVYPPRAGWLLLSAFCRGAWVRVSSFDRAIYPGHRVLPRSTLSRSSFYGGVYPGRGTAASASALRLGPHGLPALPRNAKSPQPPVLPRSPLSRTRHIAICRAELKLPRQQHRPRRARRPHERLSASRRAPNGRANDSRGPREVSPQRPR